jgi:DNA-binding PadR family transcriptional regulator
MTQEETHILKHALGLDQAKESYRNYYYAGSDHEDFDTLEKLVTEGLLTRRRDTFDEMSISYVYSVTEKGKFLLGE